MADRVLALKASGREIIPLQVGDPDFATPTPEALETAALHTRAAETIFPQLTLRAGQTAAAQLTQQAGGGAVEATWTLMPSATPVYLPTDTPVTPTLTNTPTLVSLPPTRAMR